MHENEHNLTGRDFTKLHVIGQVDHEGPVQWICRCDCGKYIYAYTNELITEDREKKKFSCGCYVSPYKTRQELFEEYKKNNMDLWRRWRLLVNGKILCKRWLDFIQFVDDVGRPPQTSSMLLRKNPKHKHGPKNTFWGSQREQASTLHKTIIYRGEEMTRKEFRRRTGVYERYLKEKLQKGMKSGDEIAGAWNRYQKRKEYVRRRENGD